MHTHTHIRVRGVKIVWQEETKKNPSPKKKTIKTCQDRKQHNADSRRLMRFAAIKIMDLLLDVQQHAVLVEYHGRMDELPMTHEPFSTAQS